MGWNIRYAQLVPHVDVAGAGRTAALTIALMLHWAAPPRANMSFISGRQGVQGVWCRRHGGCGGDAVDVSTAELQVTPAAGERAGRAWLAGAPRCPFVLRTSTADPGAFQRCRADAANVQRDARARLARTLLR